MTNNFLDDYVDVAQRLDEFKHLDPERLGRITTEIVELPPQFAAKFIAIKATVYRPGESEVAGTGYAWEPVPGLTSFTKNSEVMVCETSAVGRALVNALVASTKRGIASKEEVTNRAAGKRDAESSGRASQTRRESAAPVGSSGKPSVPPSGLTTDASSPSSATPTKSDAGLREAFGEGASTSPASGSCAHEWIAAPRAGFQACKKCGLGRKGTS